MTLSSVIMEGFALKCRNCDSDACAKREYNGDPTLWCPNCPAKVSGRAAHILVNKLNDYAAALRMEKLGYSEGEQRRIKHSPPVDPKLDFYIELLD